MKLKKENGRSFGWDKLQGWAYIDAKNSPNVTCALIITTGSHGRIKNKGSEVIYYVIEGEGEFYLKDSWIPITKDDVIIVPKNTPYDFRADNSELRLFIVHVPGYNPEDDEKVA